MLPYGIVQMETTPLRSETAFPPVTGAICGGRADPPPSPRPARRNSISTFRGLPTLSEITLRALPRVAHLADSPSLMALALIAEGVSALIPHGVWGSRAQHT
jgi:hypothetical protein